MKFLIAVFLLSSQSWAAGDVIFTCQPTNGVIASGWGFTQTVGGPRLGELVIYTDSGANKYFPDQYKEIESGDPINPSYILFLDLNGNHLLEMKDGNLIDPNGVQHDATCSVEA